MILLRHKLTGIQGMYPEHFAEYDYFEVASEEACTDCVVEDEYEYELEEEIEDE